MTSTTHSPVHAISVFIVGTGYVGLTSAACLAQLGHTVTAIDIDKAKVEALRAGRVSIVETGLDRLVSDGLDNNRLNFTTDYETIGGADIVLLCLPTPHSSGGGLDLSFIAEAVRRMRSRLSPGTVVVTKSTVPVGTHRLITEWLDRDDVSVASNPEFLREGTAVADFLGPDRVVIGAHDPRAAALVARLYAGIDAPRHTTDTTSAELIKYAANTFLAAKLSFINEMARLCDHIGADIDDVVACLGSDHRIGPDFLSPGPGWGGSCFPKDTRALAHLAATTGVELPVTAGVYDSNQRQLDYVTAEISRLCDRPLAGARIAVWGLAFKAGTNDTRDSPAVEVLHRLLALGASVHTYDPASEAGSGGATAADDPYSACRNADLLVVLTEWPEFADADLEKVADLLTHPAVYDTRSIIDQVAATKAGLTLHRIGRHQAASATA